MIRLWGKVLRPLVEAAQAKTILEIGAEFGTSTNVLLNYVRQVGGHLHSIDPLPEFDAEQLQNDNRQILSLYRDLSLNVLPSLPTFDVALIDGDHNWYTVYHELQLIEQIHGHDPLRQPLLIVHDTGWPYGRRDLYYDPATIPENFRNPYQRKGIFPRRSELADEGGMNLELCNAVKEGGERNGVLTGVEDYMAHSDLEFCFVNLPFFYGLGILVTQRRLASCPPLQEEIDKLQQALQGQQLISLAEHIRCTDGVILQTLNRQLLASEQRVEELEAELDALRSAPAGHKPAGEA